MRIHTFGLDFELDLTSLDAGLAAHLAELWRHSEVKPDTDQEPSDNPIRLQVVPEDDTTSPVPEGWDRFAIPTEPRQASYASLKLSPISLSRPRPAIYLCCMLPGYRCQEAGM